MFNKDSASEVPSLGAVMNKGKVCSGVHTREGNDERRLSG
jgi:hypothetical protein